MIDRSTGTPSEHPTISAEHAEPGQTSQARRSGGNRGLWLGGLGVLAVACCALLPLVAAGAFAGLAGISLAGLGVDGLTAAALAVVMAAVAGVLLVRRNPGGSTCGSGAGSCGCAHEESSDQSTNTRSDPRAATNLDE